MTVQAIPVPLFHPVLDRNGLVTQPWAEYFRKVAVITDTDLAGAMLKAVYDPDDNGVVDNSSALNGQPASYYLDLGNSTGTLAYSRVAWEVINEQDDVTASAGQFFDCDTSIASFTVTLPLALNNKGKMVAVRKADSTANTVTVACSGADTINGAATQTVSVQYEVMTFMSTGVEWAIV